MKINVTIIFKDGTTISAENVKMGRLMLYITDELTLDLVNFQLYMREDNIILGQCLEDEVQVKNIIVVPA